MSDSTAARLVVSIGELPPVHVAYIGCDLAAAGGDVAGEIRQHFQRVQAWVREQGHDPHSLWSIGALRTVAGRPSSYECCVQVPEEVQRGSAGVGIQELPGGRYAVVSIARDPAIIGRTIGHFHQEYIPQHDIQIDGSRPTLEIYYGRTMDYCVPIV